MTITILIVALIAERLTEVTTLVASVYTRMRLIEEASVGVDTIDAEEPSAGSHTDWTIEVLNLQEAAILTVAQHPAKIIVAEIESIVVVVDSPLVTINHIVECVAERVDEIVVNLIYVVVLTVVQSKLVSHLIGEIESLFADAAAAHASPACIANYGQHRKKR
jgi:hypothetical protein